MGNSQHRVTVSVFSSMAKCLAASRVRKYSLVGRPPRGFLTVPSKTTKSSFSLKLQASMRCFTQVAYSRFEPSALCSSRALTVSMRPSPKAGQVPMGTKPLLKVMQPSPRVSPMLIPSQPHHPTKRNRCSSPQVQNDQGGRQRRAWITRSAHVACRPQPESGDHDLRPHPCPALAHTTPCPRQDAPGTAAAPPLGTWEVLALVQGDRLPR